MDDGTEVVIKRRPKSEIISSKSEANLLRALKYHAIVEYICYWEDVEFTYTALHPVKSTLEEHIKQINSQKTTEEEQKCYLKNLTVKVLKGLNFLHQQNFSHGDVHHRNVLVDKTGQPKWIDFTASDCDGGKMKDEICRAGELTFYILSGGETYCGHNTDWKITALEWDFIEWMTKERKSLKEALHHPVFWKNHRKLMYLEALSNLNMKVTQKLQRRLNDVTRGKTFENWRSLVTPRLLTGMEHERASRGAEAEAEARSYPEDVLGLLRFIRNVLQHKPEEDPDTFLNTFPDLVESVYILARDRRWNSRPSVMRVFSDW